jgi:hypothetical protein
MSELRDRQTGIVNKVADILQSDVRPGGEVQLAVGIVVVSSLGNERTPPVSAAAQSLQGYASLANQETIWMRPNSSSLHTTICSTS